MYLHLMTDSPFIDTIIQQCDTLSDRNRYIVFGKKSKYSKSDKIKLYPSYKEFKKEGFRIEECERVFIHYLGGNAVDMILDYPSYRNYYWFFWGADGYALIGDSKDIYLPKTRAMDIEEKTLKRTIKAKLLQWFRPTKKKKAIAVKHIRKCCTWVKEDFELIRDSTGADFQFQFFSYLSTEELFKDNNASMTFNAERLSFLAGNSLNPTNNHIEMIDFLSTLTAQGNTQITMPISYGAEEKYKRSMMKYATDRLGTVKFLDTFLPYDEYMEIFKSIDVAVFFHIRQQGANNALALLWMGKILIMHKDSTLFMTLRSWGLSVLSHDEVPSLEFLQRYHREHANRLESNREILLRYISPDAVRACYKALYD